MTVAASNPGNVNLHKQIFVDVFWTIWPMWKICLGLVHAVNFHVEVVRVFVALLPLLVQQLPLFNNKLSVLSIANLAMAFATLLRTIF